MSLGEKFQDLSKNAQIYFMYLRNGVQLEKSIEKADCIFQKKKITHLNHIRQF